jgi:3-oxoacyl-[acyl-carrier protein] reductase
MKKPSASPKTSNSTFSLSGRVALVTGSSTGLGKAIAVALGAAGARVAINYFNNQARAEASFRYFQKQGFDGMLTRADVTDADSVEKMVQETRVRLGPIDIVVANATCDQPQKPIEEYDWAFFQKMVDYFIKSPFLLTRACLPDMKQRKFGRIIQIGSEVIARNVPNFSAYVAAKGGQHGLHRGLSPELAPHGITVNMVSPGWIPVERHENDPAELKEGYRKLIPAGRWGVPADVGGAVVFLASDQASFITGQNFYINGGLTVS